MDKQDFLKKYTIDSSKIEILIKRLFNIRNKRTKPNLDTKILTSWNGLMLGAIARASVVLGEEKYLEAAHKNVAFIRKNLWDDKEKRLYHRWRDGSRDDAQLFDTHAYFLSGLVALYGVTLDNKYLSFSKKTTIHQIYSKGEQAFLTALGCVKNQFFL